MDFRSPPISNDDLIRIGAPPSRSDANTSTGRSPATSNLSGPLDKLANKRRPETDDEIYGQVTNPAHYNANSKWRFMAVGLANHAYVESTMPDSLKNSTKRNHERNRIERLAVMNDPRKLGHNMAISASIIDEEHPDTVWPNGLIIETPERLVMAAHHHDMGVNNHAPKEEIEAELEKDGFSFRSADDILSQTERGRYNEVLIEKNPDDGSRETTVKATFSKIDNHDGDYFYEPIALKMQDISKELNLPHIKIRCNSRFSVNHIARNRRSNKIMYIHFKNRCYWLEGFTIGKDEGVQSSDTPMTEQQFSEMMGHLESSGVDESELSDIRERFDKWKQAA